MVAREKLLMQKIKKREQVKKQLAATKKQTNGGGSVAPMKTTTGKYIRASVVCWGYEIGADWLSGGFNK